MNPVWLQLGLISVLIAINALFAGAELALITLNRPQLERMRRAGGRAAIAARLAEDPTRFLATIQVGITFAGFLASAVAAVSLAKPLIPTFEELLGEAAAEPVAVFLVTLALAFATLVLGELAPKRIAMQRAEGWASFSSRPLWLLSQVGRPVVWLLSFATNLVVRLGGVDPSAGREPMSADEIRDVISSTAALGASQRRVISGALESSELTVRDVLVPRTDVVAIPVDATVAEGIARLMEARHTRAPVYRNDMDHVVGTVHILDLVDASGTVGDHAREVPTFPEFVRVLDALRQMQTQRVQMAMVSDERGGIDGMVTVEDLVEEVVGEIFDEFDPKVAAVRHHADGSLELEGSFPLHDLNELGIELDIEGPFTTVGGFLMERLGRVPEVGATVSEREWSFEVTEMRGVAVRTVRVIASEEGGG
ncbi:MAG: HlyC/CorC family transporter [Dehalococcoidia bacterium]|jgi:putative hemolysin|nr:HlyC/CorC family transporter [Dehalococcoidia bacterium]